MALGGFNFFNDDENTSFDDQNTFDDSSYNSFEDFSYEEETNLSKESFLDKVIKSLDSLSARQIIFLSFLGIVILSFLFILAVNINKNNKLYKAIIDIPDVVYLGESYNIRVKSFAKKDAYLAVSSFESSNDGIVTFLNGSLEGDNVYDVLLPVQEGRATVVVQSKLGNRKLGEVEKELVVCPRFDESLIFSGKISIAAGSTYDLDIDFGEDVCGHGVTYESSDNKIMSITDEGEIKGISVGSCYLIIRKDDKYFKVLVNVTSDYVSLNKLNIDPLEVQLAISQKYRISGSYLPINTSYRKLYFKDYNDEIIDVSENGVVTALKEGSTSIRVFDGNRNDEVYVKVIVYNPISKDGVEPSTLKLSHSDLTMNIGKTEKINFFISPSNTRNKTITWSSSNDDIVSVKNGVIYAKGKGIATVSAKTVNGIAKKVLVKVDSLEEPVVIASDGVASGRWHSNKYKLVVSGSVYGADYYYGLSKDTVNNKISDIFVLDDGVETYYFKACLGDVCSPIISYLSKLDSIKPVVKDIVGIEDKVVSEDLVYIYLSDSGSLVSSWCVVSTNDHTLCTWKNIKSMATPIVTYTANRNGTFYAFAKDNVGNVSSSKSFEIKNIKE